MIKHKTSELLFWGSFQLFGAKGYPKEGEIGFSKDMVKLEFGFVSVHFCKDRQESLNSFVGIQNPRYTTNIYRHNYNQNLCYSFHLWYSCTQ